MKQTVYILIKDQTIEPYHNLRHLCDSNDLPYHTLQKKMLNKPFLPLKTISHNNYTIAIRELSYKTNRKLPEKQ